MTDSTTHRHSVTGIKKSLKRLEALIKSPYVRPADIATRDRLARRLLEAKAAK